MKAVILNGSPRLNGNTRAACLEVQRGLSEMTESWQVQLIDVSYKNIHPCRGCGACANNGKCIQNDDACDILDAIESADAVFFGTPVYYWGMTAQLKTLIDRFYSRAEYHKQKKQIGLFIDGAAELEDPEYKLIEGQMKCITQYLGWSLKYVKCAVTEDKDTVAKNQALKKELYDFYTCL